MMSVAILRRLRTEHFPSLTLKLGCAINGLASKNRFCSHLLPLARTIADSIQRQAQLAQLAQLVQLAQLAQLAQFVQLALLVQIARLRQLLLPNSNWSSHPNTNNRVSSASSAANGFYFRHAQRSVRTRTHAHRY